MYNPSEMAAPILFPQEFGTRIKRYGHDHRLFSLSRPVFPGTRCLQLAFGISDPCKKDGCLNRMKDVPSSADPDGHESMPVLLRSDVTDGDLHHDCSHTGVKKITVPDVLFRHAHPAQNMDIYQNIMSRNVSRQILLVELLSKIPVPPSVQTIRFPHIV